MARRPRYTALELRLEYEQCRVWGHAWEDFTPEGKRPADWGTRFSLRCIRCMTERHDLIDAYGSLSTRQYIYPDDYKMVGDEMPTREDLRLDLLHSLRGAAFERIRDQLGD